MLVYAKGDYLNTNGTTGAQINESLPCVELTHSFKDKRVFGVISSQEDSTDTREYSTGVFVSVYEKNGDKDRFIINSLGEGALWICNQHGSINNGDYITSSDILGYGTKQDDDLLHNYTVAKITQDTIY